MQGSCQRLLSHYADRDLLGDLLLSARRETIDKRVQRRAEQHLTGTSRVLRLSRLQWIRAITSLS